MWGRESRYQDLIPHIDNIEVSHEEDLQLEEAILEEFLPMEEEMIDVFSSLSMILFSLYTSWKNRDRKYAS